MAEYYLVLKKAVSGLESSTTESRRGVYEKARSALIAQLKAIDPPLTNSEISRQRLELEEAIRRVEREAGMATAASFTDLPPPPSSSNFTVRPIVQNNPAPPDDDYDDRPEIELRPAPAGRGYDLSRGSDEADYAPRGGDRRDAAVLGPAVDMGPDRSFEPRERDSREARGRGRQGPVEPSFGGADPGFDMRADDDRIQAIPSVESERRGRGGRDSGRDAGRGRGRDNGRDRVAYDGEQRRSPVPAILLTLLILLLLGGLGALGWSQRGQLSKIIALFDQGRSSPPPSAPILPPAAPTAPDKDAERLPERSASGAPVRSVGDAAGIPAPTTTPAPAAPAAVNPSLIPVAQKAVLYEESTTTPGQVVSTLNGSIVWSYVASGPNGPVVQADITVPERSLKIRITLRKNLDAGLPASHMVEMQVDAPTDFGGGGLQSIPRLVLKTNEQERGVPINGVPMKVDDKLYWLALSQKDLTSNIALLRERGWFDLPLLYKSGQRAILTFEKGKPGEDAYQKALAAWGN